MDGEIGPPTIPGLKGCGLKVEGTLPGAGGPFSIALNNFTFLIGMIHTTSGFYTCCFLRIFSKIAKALLMIGIATRSLERARI